MYLVEIEAGREELFQSVESLASAIRSGDVGPQSRIFHRASSSWVSITVHPEYRKAAAARAAEPLPPMARRQWTFYGLEPKGRELDAPSTAGDGEEAAPSADSGESRGLLGLLGRAFRGISATPKPSEVADT
jgi:hypothetical protein